jgi:hypothetical protein
VVSLQVAEEGDGRRGERRARGGRDGGQAPDGPQSLGADEIGRAGTLRMGAHGGGRGGGARDARQLLHHVAELVRIGLQNCRRCAPRHARSSFARGPR